MNLALIAQVDDEVTILEELKIEKMKFFFNDK